MPKNKKVRNSFAKTAKCNHSGVLFLPKLGPLHWFPWSLLCKHKPCCCGLVVVRAMAQRRASAALRFQVKAAGILLFFLFASFHSWWQSSPNGGDALNPNPPHRGLLQDDPARYRTAFSIFSQRVLQGPDLFRPIGLFFLDDLNQEVMMM